MARGEGFSWRLFIRLFETDNRGAPGAVLCNDSLIHREKAREKAAAGACKPSEAHAEQANSAVSQPTSPCLLFSNRQLLWTCGVWYRVLDGIRVLGLDIK